MTRPKAKIKCKLCFGGGYTADPMFRAWHDTPCDTWTKVIDRILEYGQRCAHEVNGHDKSCACPKKRGPGLVPWLLRHGRLAVCERCNGKGRLHMHVAVEIELKRG